MASQFWVLHQLDDHDTVQLVQLGQSHLTQSITLQTLSEAIAAKHAVSKLKLLLFTMGCCSI